MRLSLICLLLTFSMLIAAGCGGSTKSSTAGSASKTVCTVDGKQITRGLVERLQAQTERSYKSAGKKLPAAGTAERKQIDQQIIDTLVQQLLLAEIASDQHVTVTDKQVQARTDQLITTSFAGDKARYKAELSKQGLTQAVVSENLRQQLLNELVFTALGKGYKPTEAQISAAYRKDRKLYGVSATRTVAHILVASPALAAKLQKQAAAHPADAKLFASLAKRYSTDAVTSTLGGQLTVEQGQTTAAFDTAAFALATGQVSKVVHTEYGYHVIRAISSTKPGHYQTLSEARSKVILTLRQTRQTLLLQKALAAKQSAAKVSCSKGYSWKPASTQAASPAMAAAKS